MAKASVQIPESNLPVQVIQLYFGEGKSREPIIIGSLWNQRFRDFLEKVLNERGIPFKSGTIDDILSPLLVGDAYEVAGMGFCRRNVKYFFYGESSEYKIGIGQRHLYEVKKANPDFDFEIIDF